MFHKKVQRGGIGIVCVSSPFELTSEIGLYGLYIFITYYKELYYSPLNKLSYYII